MKITPEDPRLSAYLLGELDAAEAVEIERAAAADPALRLALRELERTTACLSGLLAPAAPQRLLESQRRAIRRAIAEVDAPPVVLSIPSPRRSLRPVLTGMAAAVVVAIAAIITGQMGKSGGDGAISDEIALLPMPGPEAAAGPTRVAAGRTVAPAKQVEQLAKSPATYFGEAARRFERAPLPAAEGLAATADSPPLSTAPSLRLPVVLGTGSAVWVRRWIREKSALPPRDAVRTEELINSISIPTRTHAEGLEIGIEEIPCPWNPNGKLIALGTRATADQSGLEIRWQSDAPRRVLGSFGQRSDAGLPTLLPAGRGNLILLEIADATMDPGSLIIRQQSREERISISALTRPAGESARQAVALSVFARWLRGEEGITPTMLRDAAQTPGDAVWQDTRRLIEEALDLAEGS